MNSVPTYFFDFRLLKVTSESFNSRFEKNQLISRTIVAHRANQLKLWSWNMCELCIRHFLAFNASMSFGAYLKINCYSENLSHRASIYTRGLRELGLVYMGHFGLRLHVYNDILGFLVYPRQIYSVHQIVFVCLLSHGQCRVILCNLQNDLYLEQILIHYTICISLSVMLIYHYLKMVSRKLAAYSYS